MEDGAGDGEGGGGRARRGGRREAVPQVVGEGGLPMPRAACCNRRRAKHVSRVFACRQIVPHARLSLFALPPLLTGTSSAMLPAALP